jgi:peptide deformylase
MKIIQDENVLKQISTEATVDEAKTIIRELEATLSICNNGVGLSAIQIGIAKRVFIVKDRDGYKHFINPKLVSCEGEFIFENEGCLSFPGIALNTHRYYHYVIARDVLEGDSFRQETNYFYYPETTDEFESREFNIASIAVQHEMDHLDGKVLIDYGLEKIKKVGRNDPCPCGKTINGKPIKYKKCCG